MNALLLALVGLATAQDLGGLDAHGVKITSLQPSTVAPIRVYQPQAFEAWDFYGGLIGEFAKQPLVLTQRETDGTLTRIDAVDDLLALNLGAGLALHERVRLELGLPFYAAYSREDGVTSVDPAPGLGDMRLAAQVVVLRPPEDGGFSLALVPFVDLPTGMEDQFLGQSGVSGGGRLALSLDLGKLVLGGDAGVIARPSTSAALNLSNPLGAEVGLHAGYRLTERLGLNLEGTSTLPFASNLVVGTEAPMELTGTLHGVQDSGLTWLLGGAGGLSEGAGTADWRLFAGIGWGKVRTEEPEPEPVVPVEGAISIEVMLDGKRVFNAPVSVEGPKPLEVMSALEPVLYEHLSPGDVYTGSATSGPCMAGTGTATVPEGATAPMVIELKQKLSAQVRLEIYDAEDKPLKGGIVTWEREVENCVPGEPLVLKESHTGRQSVGVGEHSVFVTVEGYNTFAESVTLKEGDDELIVVKLAPTKVQVTAERIEILEKVYFEFDGDQIDKRSAALLDEVANVLRRNPDILKLEVAGHTDDKGADIYNLDLSQRRVESVRTWLIERRVSPDRLVAKGYGETTPIATNKTAAGRAENRRVEFTILERVAGEDNAIIRQGDGKGPTEEQVESGAE